MRAAIAEPKRVLGEDPPRNSVTPRAHGLHRRRRQSIPHERDTIALEQLRRAGCETWHSGVHQLQLESRLGFDGAAERRNARVVVREVAAPPEAPERGLHSARRPWWWPSWTSETEL